MYSRSALSLLCFGSLSLAQFTGSFPVRGELSGQIPAAGGLYVQLRDLGGHTRDERAWVNSDGSFDFRNMTEGTYEASLMSQNGQELHVEIVSLNSFHNRFTMRLPQKASEPAPGGTVSLARLRHQVPKQARQAFDRADKAARRGSLDESIQLLRKAIEIDPEFQQAHNNLGARYLSTRQHQLARIHLLRALELDPSAAEVHTNLSYLALVENDPREAESLARRGLALGADAVSTGYFLGLALLQQHRVAEARPLLEQAAQRYPSARRTLNSLFPPQNQR